MLTLPTISIGVALLVAIGALWRARSVALKLERLTESYWELRYESGQIKSRVNRLELEAGVREAEPDAPRVGASATSFVPLSSLKK